MAIRDHKREVLHRLEGKTLDARFRTIVQEGLGCSPFESQAILQVVHEVYGPHMGEASSSPMPGQISLVAVAADEPAGKPLDICEKRTVVLRLHRGPEDDRLLQEEGPQAFRRRRIPDLCQEALSQGALLTREDLAYRIFMVSPRTISRDLRAFMSDSNVVLPIRSLKHDIGPVLSHRVQIVRLALEGKTMTEICQRMHHSPEAVANYLGVFTRVAQLVEEGMQVGQIAFLLRRGKGLIQKYIDLIDVCRHDRNLEYHFRELLSLARAGEEKRGSGRGGQ